MIVPIYSNSYCETECMRYKKIKNVLNEANHTYEVRQRIISYPLIKPRESGSAVCYSDDMRSLQFGHLMQFRCATIHIIYSRA